MAVRLVRRLARLLPRTLGVPLLTWLAPARRHTVDHRTVPMPAPFTLDVYWLVDRTGDSGPAASVRIGREEVLRLDGLRRRPHVHYGLAESRWLGASGHAVRVPVTDTVALVQRLGFELAHNLGWCLVTSRRRSRRRLAVRLDDDGLEQAAAAMIDAMLGIAERHEAIDA